MPERPDMQNRLLGVDGLLTLPTLEAYRGAGGYMALRRAVTDMTPAEVINEIKASGLRGRGGAPTEGCGCGLVDHQGPI